MFKELLSRLANLLDNRGIPYMIIGGQAVLLYGEPRLTRDIDITLGINIDRLDEVLEIVRTVPLKALPEDISDFITRTMVLPCLHEGSGIRVDFIFSFTPYEQMAIRRARKVKILGKDVSFCSPEDLIIHKVFAGRPRDIEDVRNVLLKNPGIDINYIERWLKELDISGEGNFLNTFREVLKNIRQ